ncbi:hypothetical protein AAZV13_18G104400 [Glycine max]
MVLHQPYGALDGEIVDGGFELNNASATSMVERSLMVAQTERIACMTSRFRPAWSTKHTVAFTRLGSPSSSSEKFTITSSHSLKNGHAFDRTELGSLLLKEEDESPCATSSDFLSPMLSPEASST